MHVFVWQNRGDFYIRWVDLTGGGETSEGHRRPKLYESMRYSMSNGINMLKFQHERFKRMKTPNIAGYVWCFFAGLWHSWEWSVVVRLGICRFVLQQRFVQIVCACSSEYHSTPDPTSISSPCFTPSGILWPWSWREVSYLRLIHTFWNPMIFHVIPPVNSIVHIDYECN